MKFDKEKLINIAKAINEDNYTFSNEVLYAACGGIDVLPKPLDKETAEELKSGKEPCEEVKNQLDKFCSMMLIIGRAYAASPERRKGAIRINDGMDTFFKKLAKNIVFSSEDYEAWYRSVKELSGREYGFESFEKDEKTLIDSVKCVCKLNEMVRKAIEGIDKSTDLNKVNNCVSFCSKLMHFVVPEIFYIIDGISGAGAKAMYTEKKTEVTMLAYRSTPLADEEKFTMNVEERNDFKKLCGISIQLPEFITNEKTSKVKQAHKEYFNHCLRTYGVSKVLNEAKIKPLSQTRGFAGAREIRSMPRLVDSVVMRVTKK